MVIYFLILKNTQMLKTWFFLCGKRNSSSKCIVMCIYLVCRSNYKIRIFGKLTWTQANKIKIYICWRDDASHVKKGNTIFIFLFLLLLFYLFKKDNFLFTTQGSKLTELHREIIPVLSTGFIRSCDISNFRVNSYEFFFLQHSFPC